MKLSCTVRYAIQAVLQLARSYGNPPISCRQIALEGQMPVRFLMHIMRRLADRGIVESSRGVDGGYKLARPPQAISLLDIFEAAGEPFTLEVDGETAIPTETLQRLKSCLADAADAARRRLAAVRVSHLIGGRKRLASTGH